jgi:hypothetical protein
MAKGITGANAVFMLSITDLFPAPQQLQGFSSDDVFETDPLTSVETIMGVDGHMSAGFVFVEVKQNISIQADSDSNAIFEAWWGAQQVSRSVLFANGVIILTDVGTKWAMVNGVLSTFPPIPNAKKLL